MPYRTAPAPPIPVDPLEWRPQRARPSRRPASIRNALIEPLWEGDHVLAHFDASRYAGDGEPWLCLVSDGGEDLTDMDLEVTSRLRAAVRCGDAVIDGFLTDQATRAGDTVSLATTVKSMSMNPLTSTRVVVGVEPPEPERPFPLAFVAVDLLRVDGEDLFDIPLLERKRILESIVVQEERVRVSPFTQPPISGWLLSWSAAGFRGAMVKAMDSLYVPGGETADWTAAIARRQR